MVSNVANASAFRNVAPPGQVCKEFKFAEEIARLAGVIIVMKQRLEPVVVHGAAAAAGGLLAKQ
jgi:hypothetical protein